MYAIRTDGIGLNGYKTSLVILPNQIKSNQIKTNQKQLRKNSIGN